MIPLMPRLVSALLLALYFSSIALFAEMEPQKFIYKEVDGQSLELFVFLPEHQSTPTPAIVWYYGSGFNKREPGQFFEHGKILAKLGMASISTKIRGAAGNRENRDITPCLEDAKSAFRWVRSRVDKFNLDPDRIAVGGGSSGGYLAAAMATLPDFDTPSEDLKVPVDPSLQVLFNPFLGRVDFPKELAPLKNVTKDTPPAILFQGTEDTTTPLSLAYQYQISISQPGNESRVVVYEGQKHGFFNYRDGGNPYYYKTVGDMLVFLEAHGYLK